MTDILASLKDTPLALLFILAGLFFLLLSVAAKVGGLVEVSPSQQRVAIPIGLSLLTVGIILNFQAPQTAVSLGPIVSPPQGRSSQCERFLAIGRNLNWKIVNQDGIVNAGTLEVIAMSRDAKEWEAEQTTQTKGNKKLFLKGTFSDSMISLNRGDSEKWIGECKEDKITGKIKTTYSPDMDFEIQ